MTLRSWKIWESVTSDELRVASLWRVTGGELRQCFAEPQDTPATRHSPLPRHATCPPLATQLAFQDFLRVLSSTSPVRESSAACVESSDVIPRPMTRRPPVELEEPEALRELLERDEVEALRALLTFLLDDLLRLEPLAPLLELPFPPLALIPPLLRFGMLILG